MPHGCLIMSHPVHMSNRGCCTRLSVHHSLPILFLSSDYPTIPYLTKPNLSVPAIPYLTIPYQTRPDLILTHYILPLKPHYYRYTPQATQPFLGFSCHRLTLSYGSNPHRRHTVPASPVPIFLYHSSPYLPYHSALRITTPYHTAHSALLPYITG